MANLKDFATSKVQVAPSPDLSGTSLQVTATHGVRFPDAPFNAVLHPAYEVPTLDTAERVLVTAKAGDTFTISRAQGGTTAKPVQTDWRITNAVLEEDLDAKADLASVYIKTEIDSSLATKANISHASTHSSEGTDSFDGLTINPSKLSAPSTSGVLTNPGDLIWDTTRSCYAYMNDQGVINYIGEFGVVRGKNVSGQTLTKGTVVQISGTVGNSGTVTFVKYDGTKELVGVLEADADNNQIVDVLHHGDITGINTTSFATPELYAQTDGTIGTAETKWLIGEVTNSHTNGSIQVNVRFNAASFDHTHPPEIVYQSTEPTDTSLLWVDTSNDPTAVSFPHYSTNKVIDGISNYTNSIAVNWTSQTIPGTSFNVSVPAGHRLEVEAHCHYQGVSGTGNTGVDFLIIDTSASSVIAESMSRSESYSSGLAKYFWSNPTGQSISRSFSIGVKGDGAGTASFDIRGISIKYMVYKEI